MLGATPLPDFHHPKKALYIFGPENSTVLQSDIDKADAVVYIPTIGCMNIAASVNVLLYDRMVKSADWTEGDELILTSRQQGNNRKVKHHNHSEVFNSAACTNLAESRLFEESWKINFFDVTLIYYYP